MTVESGEAIATSIWQSDAGRRRNLPLAVRGFRFLALEKPLAGISVVILLLVVVCAIGAPILAPYDPVQQSADAVYAAPGLSHPMGADNVGRDTLSRVIYGARISLIVGFSAVAIGTSLAAAIGILGGYLGGKTDLVLSRLVDAFMAFPSLVFLLLFLAIFGPGLRNVVFAIALFLSFAPSRVVRSAALVVKQYPYIEAARAVGASELRILLRYILPNVFPVVIVIATIGLGGAILTEASLSFLGLGVPPPAVSWGYMIGGASRSYFLKSPWMVIFPGIVLSMTVYAFNMLGDVLRDVLDPRLRGR